MNFYINSPACYTVKHGVIDEIYQFCATISRNIDIRDYTKIIDTIAITPIIAPKIEIDKGMWTEEKRISLTFRMASISIRTSYEDFCVANLDDKKKIILDNIFASLFIIKSKMKDDFDFDSFKEKILEITKENN